MHIYTHEIVHRYTIGRFKFYTYARILFYCCVLTRMFEKLRWRNPFFFDSLFFFFLPATVITILTIVYIYIHTYVCICGQTDTDLRGFTSSTTYWRTPENPSHRNGTVALAGFLILSVWQGQQQNITSLYNTYTRLIALNSYYTFTDTLASHAVRV